VLHKSSLRESLRLRPELLRRLGWHYVRVHAFELFSDPDAVAHRIMTILGASEPAPITEPLAVVGAAPGGAGHSVAGSGGAASEDAGRAAAGHGLATASAPSSGAAWAAAPAPAPGSAWTSVPAPGSPSASGSAHPGA